MSLVIKAARAASQGTIPSRGRGDPGVFGDLFAAAKRGVVGFLGGGPVGAVANVIRPRAPAPRVPTTQIRLSNNRSTITVPAPGIASEFQRAFKGGATGTMQVGCLSGFHPNKSSYFLKDGSFVEEGTRCVKNRRRNPLNPRALSQSIGRIKSAKLASKAMGRITIREKDAHHHHRKRK